MKCDEAKKLIDERVHSERDPQVDGGRDWSALDEHLAGCESCSADYAALSRVGGLLGAVERDRPSRREMESMWASISAVELSQMNIGTKPVKRWRWRRRLVQSVGVAAVLVLVVFGVGFLDGNVRETFYRVGDAIGVGPGLSRARELSKTLVDKGDKYDFRSHATAEFGYQSPSADDIETRSSTDSDVIGDDRLAAASIPMPPPPPKPKGQGGYQQDQSERGSRLAKRGTKGWKLESPTTNEEPEAYFMLRPPSGEQVRGEVNTEHELPSQESNSTSNGQTATGEEPVESQQTVRRDAKVIKTGQVQLEVDEYGAAVERVEETVARFGGYVADVVTAEGAGGALSGRLVIRVEPDGFDALFGALKGVGRLEKEDVKAADVTAQYVDIEARIASLRMTEQRLQELVKSKSFIDKIESLLEVEREMTRVRSQIEQLMGQLRVMADRVAMSTITVELHEPSRTVPQASYSVEVETVEEAAARLGVHLESMGGRLMSGKTMSGDDGSLRGEYTVQISLARFDELLAAVESLGRVEERQLANRRYGQTVPSWAERVTCYVSLVFFERSQRMPFGKLDIEVKSLDAALTRLDSMLAAMNGAVASNVITRAADGSQSANVQVRVSAGRFSELVSAVGELGRTTGKNVSGQSGRIVGGAANQMRTMTLVLSEAHQEVPQGAMRIEVNEFKASARALSALIAGRDLQVAESSSHQVRDGTWNARFVIKVRAGDMEGVVAEVQKFGRVRSQKLAGLGLGDLSRVDPGALGRLELELFETPAMTSGPAVDGDSIRARFRSGVDGLVYSVGLMVEGVLTALPWLAVAGPLIWVGYRMVRRRRGARLQTS